LSVVAPAEDATAAVELAGEHRDESCVVMYDAERAGQDGACVHWPTLGIGH
jgi:hypothetical protein